MFIRVLLYVLSLALAALAAMGFVSALRDSPLSLLGLGIAGGILLVGLITLLAAGWPQADIVALLFNLPLAIFGGSQILAHVRDDPSPTGLALSIALLSIAVVQMVLLLIRLWRGVGSGSRLLWIVVRQMRQRALGTALTLLSVVLGSALAIAVLVFWREGDKFFAQSDFGYDLIVGPKGDDLQLVFNSVFHVGTSQGVVPYSIYENLSRPAHPMVRWAIPYAVGDEYEGHRVIGTVPQILPMDDAGKAFAAARVFKYRKDKMLSLGSGRNFHPQKFEAVIGAEVSKKTGLKVGSKFKAEHGAGAARASKDEHGEEWTVVGVLAPTRTALDRVIYIPLVSFYAIPDHGKGMEDIAKMREMWEIAQGIRQPEPASRPATGPAKDDDHDHAPATKPASGPAKAGDHDDDHDHAPATKPGAAPTHDNDHGDDEHAGHQDNYHMDGDLIHLELPKEKWKLSAILVSTRGGFQQISLTYGFRNTPDAMAVNPVDVMSRFYRNFLDGFTRLLLLLAVLVSIVAIIGILVSIYNSVMARRKEIAILRALGATQQRVLLILCLEAGLIGLIGGAGGLLVGHALALGVSAIMEGRFGQGINWLAPGAWEAVYLGCVAMVATLAGWVPALKAYSTPVADNLVAS